jgi:hypothetical protein
VLHGEKQTLPLSYTRVVTVSLWPRCRQREPINGTTSYASRATCQDAKRTQRTRTVRGRVGCSPSRQPRHRGPEPFR